MYVTYKHNPQQNELEATPYEELTGSYKYKQAHSNKGGKCHGLSCFVSISYRLCSQPSLQSV